MCIEDRMDPLIGGLENNIKKSKKLNSSFNNSSDNTRRSTIKRKQRGKENNCMDISSGKQARFQTKNLGIATKGKPEERNGIPSSSNTKQRHRNQLY